MQYSQFKTISPEAKRRLAAELLEFKIKKSGYRDPNFLHEWCSETYYFKEEFKFIVGDFRPDESLDQVRLLENKAKENEKVWDKYTEQIEFLFELYFYNSNGGENWYQVTGKQIGQIATLTADEKLFALFQAFGVIDDLKEDR